MSGACSAGIAYSPGVVGASRAPGQGGGGAGAPALSLPSGTAPTPDGATQILPGIAGAGGAGANDGLPGVAAAAQNAALL